VLGLPPFRIEGSTKFCSFECFLKWYADNVKNINYVMSDKEMHDKASDAIKDFKNNRVKGGIARAESLTPERRSGIAKNATKARWNKDK
jgi:hypothetical protein